MNKDQINQLAQDTLKKFPDAKSVFITSDYQVFLTKNACDLHKNTNPKKKLESVEIKKTSFSVDNSEETGAEKPLNKLKKAELETLAKELKVDITSASNNGDRVKLIEAAQKAAQENAELFEKLPKMNEEDLKKVAESKGIRVDDAADKTAIIALIEDTLNAKIQE